MPGGNAHGVNSLKLTCSFSKKKRLAFVKVGREKEKRSAPKRLVQGMLAEERGTQRGVVAGRSEQST